MNNQTVFALPRWVPEGAKRYLAHTETGQSIRDLARCAGCHASTVMRQIRRVETQRDDPLVDAALSALAAAHFPPVAGRTVTAKHQGSNNKDFANMTSRAHRHDPTPDVSTLEREACRILRRMCETGAVLAVAEDMEKAVVVRDGEGTSSTRTAVVECEIAEAMALKGWISCTAPGRISRYLITAAGRSALGRLMAASENHARAEKEHGFAEAQAPFGGPSWGEKTIDDPETSQRRRVRYNASESPLAGLARRKDKDGQPFLTEDLVHAGERVREDFELAQMGPSVTQNWDHFLTGGARGGFAPDSGTGDGPTEARNRVAKALAELGPGLSDVILRCCCYLEGLETAEKRMGWSARSGKIVLRIALQRLKRHYDGLAGRDRMIG